MDNKSFYVEKAYMTDALHHWIGKDTSSHGLYILNNNGKKITLEEAQRRWRHLFDFIKLDTAPSHIINVIHYSHHHDDLIEEIYGK